MRAKPKNAEELMLAIEKDLVGAYSSTGDRRLNEAKIRAGLAKLLPRLNAPANVRMAATLVSRAVIARMIDADEARTVLYAMQVAQSTFAAPKRR